MKHQAALDFDSKVEVIINKIPSDVTAKMIEEELLSKLSLTSDDAKNCFSIWITSPYLRMSNKEIIFTIYCVQCMRMYVCFKHVGKIILFVP